MRRSMSCTEHRDHTRPSCVYCTGTKWLWGACFETLELELGHTHTPRLTTSWKMQCMLTRLGGEAPNRSSKAVPGTGTRSGGRRSRWWPKCVQCRLQFSLRLICCRLFRSRVARRPCTYIFPLPWRGRTCATHETGCAKCRQKKRLTHSAEKQSTNNR